LVIAKRQLSLRLDTELVAAVREQIGPLGLMSETVAEALQLWLATKRDSASNGVSVPPTVAAAAHEPPDEPKPMPQLPWNALRPLRPDYPYWPVQAFFRRDKQTSRNRQVYLTSRAVCIGCELTQRNDPTPARR
jgi:hypothetical protein